MSQDVHDPPLALPTAIPVVYSRRERDEFGVAMLDAYIIDKIRREQDSHDSRRLPLHIDVPRRIDDSRQRIYEEPPSGRRDEDSESERGVVIIDFSI